MKKHLADLNVLVVEDHEFQRLVAEQTLKGLGIFDLLLASNGNDALQKLKHSEPVDIVICDLDMPEMDGIQFIRHLADHDYTSAIIVASALKPALIRTVQDLAQEHGLEYWEHSPNPFPETAFENYSKSIWISTQPPPSQKTKINTSLSKILKPH